MRSCWKREQEIDTTSFENDLQLGNPDARLQIMVACNPYCGPCAKTHKILHELVEKNDIGLTIRFIVKNKNNSDSKRGGSETYFGGSKPSIY